MENPKIRKFVRIVLTVIYPALSLACGLATWLVIRQTMPDEPQPTLYGAGTALLTALYLYGRTWWDFRKKRRTARAQP